MVGLLQIVQRYRCTVGSQMLHLRRKLTIFCRKTARYGSTFKTNNFPQVSFPFTSTYLMAETDCGSQYYAKLTAYAGQRLNDNTLKQTAWDVLNKNTTGIWPPVTQVGGTDVVNPVNEVCNPQRPSLHDLMDLYALFFSRLPI